jgi:hypothetical protein
MSARTQSHEFCGRCPRCEAAIKTCRDAGAPPELAPTRRRPQYRPVVSALAPRQRRRPGAGLLTLVRADVGAVKAMRS